MDLKTYIKLTVDADKYYATRFPQWNPRTRGNVICCFHEDTSPSLALSLNNGGAKCHAASCASSFGNIVHFEATKKSISEEDAAKNLYSEFIRPIVDSATVQKFHEDLLADQKWIEWLLSDCGFTRQTILDFMVGLDKSTRRVVFPIRNRFGDVVNLRLYKLPRHRAGRDKHFKVINYIESKGGQDEQRYGGIELFPWPRFSNYDLSKPIFICASEKECMLAIQCGLQAVCSTNGEGSWNPEWTEMFTCFNIGILMDQDAGGDKAAEKLFATLQLVANQCFIIKLDFPLEYHGDKDFDDWIIKANGSGTALLSKYQILLQHPTLHTFDTGARDKLAKPLTPSLSGTAQSARKDRDLSKPALPEFWSDKDQPLDLIRGSTAMLNRRVFTKGIVAAMAQRSYDIPWRFRLNRKNHNPTFHVVPVGRELINFVNLNDNQIEEVIIDQIKDTKASVEASDFLSVTEVEIIPIAEVGEESRYTVQRCFAVGTDIEANVPYRLTLIPTTLYRTQEKVAIIVSCERLSSSIEARDWSEEEMKNLKRFRPLKEESVWDKLCNVANYVSENFTNIYSRDDWHIAALLSWFSPIGWRLPRPNESIQRGWLNTLAVGDTKTGKSEVVKHLQSTLRAGEIVNAENCTYVGLVGGAVKMGSGQFMLRWGRIPLCDKQLVVVEELSGLSIEEISNLSDIRSSGIARLDKGGLVGRTTARTRLICISNVRSRHKTLADYLSGVTAIKDLIGHAEDISRFDLIITLIDSEVPSEIINTPSSRRDTEVDERGAYAKDLSNLLQFVWSLKPEQIEFSEQAYLHILSEAQRLGGIYHPSIPIFKASSDRYKIARIAASIATLQFCWDGKKIQVAEDHVRAATKLLQLLYDKPSFGYRDYSIAMQERQQIGDEALLDETLLATVSSESLRKVVSTIIHATRFNKDELMSTASIGAGHADDLIGCMSREHALRKGEANVWELTPAGKRWLQKHINTNESKTTSRNSNTRKQHTGRNGHSKADKFDQTRYS